MKKFYLLISLCLTLISNVFAQKDTTLYSDKACYGSNYYIGDSAVTESGLYYYTDYSDSNHVYGVDLLFLDPTPSGVYIITKCLGDSTYIPGTGFVKVAGTYPSETINRYGCDSTVNYIVSFIKQGKKDTTMTICNGKKALLRSKYYTTAGNYVIKIANGTRCDSLLTLHLVVNPTYSMPATNIALTNYQPYSFYGIPVTRVGLYQKTLYTKNGCDSTLRLNVTSYTNVTQQREESISKTSYTESEDVKIYDTKGTLIGEGKPEDLYPNLKSNEMYIINSQKKLIKQ